jgi:PilZ domain
MGNLSTIGLGGCGVELQTSVETGTRVEVTPLENERLSVVGTVVNLRILSGKPGYGIGIEFAEADEQKAELVKFVEQKTQVDDQEYWRSRMGTRTEEGNP